MREATCGHTVGVGFASEASPTEAEDDRGSLVKSFRALIHSVHPNGPRGGFISRSRGCLPPFWAAMPSGKPSIVGDAW
jgi:hypothetical protein